MRKKHARKQQNEDDRERRSRDGGAPASSGMSENQRQRALEEVRKREGEDGELDSESADHIRRRTHNRGSAAASASSTAVTLGQDRPDGRKRPAEWQTEDELQQCPSTQTQMLVDDVEMTSEHEMTSAVEAIEFGRTSLGWRQGAVFEACEPSE